MKLDKFKQKLNALIIASSLGNKESVEQLIEDLTIAYENQLDIVSACKHNIDVLKEREQIGIRRMTNVVRCLEEQGLTAKEITDIIKLGEENI